MQQNIPTTGFPICAEDLHGDELTTPSPLHPREIFITTQPHPHT